MLSDGQMGKKTSNHFITKARILKTSGEGGGSVTGEGSRWGLIPGSLAAFNVLTWVAVVLKLTSKRHRCLLLFLDAYHSSQL